MSTYKTAKGMSNKLSCSQINRMQWLFTSVIFNACVCQDPNVTLMATF